MSGSLQLSVLDLSPVPSGSSASVALRNTLDLARHADELGYVRYWLAEHHNSPGLASPVPAVMIGHVASVTSRIRVGSGGVMLPNHSPLQVAESFRVLEALHPGRIDLGLGRAPGTDQLTAFALRRSREAMAADDFPDQLAELCAFFSGQFPDDHPFRRIRAMPEGVATPPIWLLGSSDFSARLAAQQGLGFAFAHHINPASAIDALRLYRDQFKPSRQFPEPAALIGVAAVCADTDARAEKIAASAELARLRYELGRPGPIPSMEEAASYPYSTQERQFLRANRARLFVGSAATVADQLAGLAHEAGVSEVMVTSIVHDHQDRRRSYSLLAEQVGRAGAAQARAG